MPLNMHSFVVLHHNAQIIARLQGPDNVMLGRSWSLDPAAWNRTPATDRIGNQFADDDETVIDRKRDTIHANGFGIAWCTS
jgi:hypothetical protein